MSDKPHEPLAHPSGLELVMTRAATDRAFRRRLLEDPRCAIRDTFGIEPPRGLTMRFIEKDPGVDLMLVLPDPIDSTEPAAMDLDAVSGGVSWEWLTCES